MKDSQRKAMFAKKKIGTVPTYPLFEGKKAGTSRDTYSLKDVEHGAIVDYQVTSRKPKGYGTTRSGYKSDRTGKYHTWVNNS